MTRPSLVRRPALLASLAVLALGALGAGLYAPWRGENSRACKAARDTAKRLAPLARGEVAGFEVRPDPKPAPDLAFTGPDGQTMRLADLKGRTLLVNLWATWCAPCKAEMPALDALQRRFGGPDFAVVAVNLDTRNTDRPRAWLSTNGIRDLAYYADPGGRLLPALQKAQEGDFSGLPANILVDPAGCAVAVLRGPAEWTSADAAAFLGAAIGRGG